MDVGDLVVRFGGGRGGVWPHGGAADGSHLSRTRSRGDYGTD